MLLATLLLASLAAVPAAPVQDDGAAAPPDSAPALEPWRRDLLDLAFEVAGKLPLQPHAKTRARVQEEVALTCLELDQPGLALEFAEVLRGFRRGTVLAEAALWHAGHGRPEDAERCLQAAGGVVDGPWDEDAQAWQRDRIRARIAATHMLQGRDDLAAPFAADLESSELGPVAEQRAARITPEEADAFLAGVETVYAGGDFAQVGAALSTCAGILERFWDDAERRELAEARLRAGLARMPVNLRVEGLARLAAVALDHDQVDQARAVLDEAGELVAGEGLLPETRVPLQARLAELRARAGQPGAARHEADRALLRFEAELQEIQGTRRADVLRSLAEAYHALGDRDGALTAFRRVVELGVANPNSRPRAEDLAATCCSLARIGLEPDEALAARLAEIAAALGPPW